MIERWCVKSITSVQSLAGVLPQKALQTDVEPGLDAGKYLQEMAKWKEWAESPEGVKVFISSGSRSSSSLPCPHCGRRFREGNKMHFSGVRLPYIYICPD